MRKAAKIHWSRLAPLAKWAVLGLLLAIAGAVGCVNMSLAPAPSQPLTGAKPAPKYPGYAAAQLKKRPSPPTPKPNQIAKSSKRTSPTSTATASRSSTGSKSTEKPSQALPTAFDARRRPVIQQASARAENRSRIIRAGGTSVSDPFLDLPNSGTDEPVAVPGLPAQETAEQLHPRFLPPPDSEESDSAPAAPRRVTKTPPPLPIERTDSDEQPDQAPVAERVPVLEQSSEDAFRNNLESLKPLAPRSAANSAPRAKRPHWTSPAAMLRRKSAPKIVDENNQEEPPAPPRTHPPHRVAPRVAALRANLRRDKTPVETPVEHEKLQNGEELRSLEPEMAPLPRLTETPVETPQVDLLPPPPHIGRESLASEIPAPSKTQEPIPPAKIPRREPTPEPQMAETFSQAAETNPLPPPASVFANGGGETPWPRSRGIPAKTVGRQVQRPSRQSVANESPAPVSSAQPSIHSTAKIPAGWPIIRPANRTGQLTVSPAQNPRVDNASLTRTNSEGHSVSVPEAIDEGNPANAPPEVQQVQPRLAPSSKAGQPVRLDGIVIEDDDQPVTPAENPNRVALMPPDISDFSPSHVPPPPVSAVPPPLMDPAPLPTAGTPKSSKAKKGQKLAAAPAVPRDAKSSLDFPYEEGAENDTIEARGPSLIGKTSLIGFCIGITGLIGLIVWRVLDRRGRQDRKINLSILNTPASSATTGADTDQAQKSVEFAAKVEAPRLHRAA